MKKGMILFAMIVFLVFSCSQSVFANITLNVNAKAPSTANKLYYMTGESLATLKTFTLPWKEKAVYGDMGETMVTVTNKLAGHIIVKMDVVATTGSAISVLSYILKYGTGSGPFTKEMAIVPLDTTFDSAYDETNLSNYQIEDEKYPVNTTITLLDFTDNWNFSGYIVFTAILIDDISATNTTPQIIGVDTQTIFFNYINTPASITKSTSNGQWFHIISNGRK